MTRNRFRGATTIHTKRSCQHWSLGSWEVAGEAINVNGFFVRREVAREDISEIRMVKKPMPEFTVVCSDEGQAFLCRLSMILPRSARRLVDHLNDCGYKIDQIDERTPKGQRERDEKSLGLAPDSP